MHIRSAAPSLVVGFLAPSLSRCLVHPPKRDAPQVNTFNLPPPTLPQLTQQINTEAREIHSLSATVEIATSLGGTKKGQVTDIQQIKGNILEKDPDMLHVLGRLPLVGSRAFDMVSDGTSFK